MGDGITKVSGIIKCVNDSKQCREMEPSAMFVLNNKLYFRDYNETPTPFKVYDCATLEVDTEMSDKIKTHFESILK